MGGTHDGHGNGDSSKHPSGSDGNNQGAAEEITVGPQANFTLLDQMSELKKIQSRSETYSEQGSRQVISLQMHRNKPRRTKSLKKKGRYFEIWEKRKVTPENCTWKQTLTWFECLALMGAGELAKGVEYTDPIRTRYAFDTIVRSSVELVLVLVGDHLDRFSACRTNVINESDSFTTSTWTAKIFLHLCVGSR